VAALWGAGDCAQAAIGSASINNVNATRASHDNLLPVLRMTISSIETFRLCNRLLASRLAANGIPQLCGPFYRSHQVLAQEAKTYRKKNRPVTSLATGRLSISRLPD
jgi:hypothetical protein